MSTGKFGKPSRKVSFSSRAIVNLIRLDRLAIASDYSVRLEILAEALDKVDDSDIGEAVSEVCRTGMGLLLVKLEQYAGEKERYSNQLAEIVQYKIETPQEVTLEGKDILKRTIEELKCLKKLS